MLKNIENAKTYKNQENCPICSSSNVQKKILLQKVYVLLKNRIKTQINVEKSALKIQTGRQFDRLMTIIDPSFKKMILPFCDHKSLIQSFISALKCTDCQFFSLCDTLAGELAKKNYQLDVLVYQIKSTGNTILTEVQSKFKSYKNRERAARKQPSNQNLQQNLSIYRYSPVEQKSSKKEELYDVESQKIIASNKTLESHLPKKALHQMYSIQQNEIYWANFSLHMNTPYFYIPFPQHSFPNTFL